MKKILTELWERLNEFKIGMNKEIKWREGVKKDEKLKIMEIAVKIKKLGQENQERREEKLTNINIYNE